jgi:nucleoside transporter
MNRAVTTRLCIMMFIQFFVWGAWYVTVGNYMTRLGMSETIYWAYTVGPMAALISPFFLGFVADRYFSTERVLAALHIVGGIALLLTPQMAELSVRRAAEAPVVAGELFINPAHLPFVGILLVHMLCYMPTIGLTNTLAFHNLTNQEKQFPLVRVFGTIGWIVAGVLVSYILKADEKALPLQIAGAAGIAMGLYSFSLPHTPPPAAGRKATVREVAGLDALGHLGSRSFWVFLISSVLICIPLSAYYAYAPVFVNAAGLENPAFKMSFGQMSEVLFMLIMPLCFVRLGVKWMLFVGMLAWVLRYVLFAIGAPDGVMWMIMGGILLHGICYDFFFVTGYIYVDKKAAPQIRGQAQGIVVLLTLGVGMLIGGIVSGQLFNRIVVADSAEVMKQWQTFWTVPAIGAAVIMGLFAMLFKDDSTPKVTDGEVSAAVAGEELP